MLSNGFFATAETHPSTALVHSAVGHSELRSSKHPTKSIGFCFCFCFCLRELTSHTPIWGVGLNRAAIT
jgi:hypothetical protein